MKRGYQTTTTTRYKMYKKGRIWMFSAVVIGTGAFSVTTIAHGYSGSSHLNDISSDRTDSDLC
ncbi:KxYKxGKxW signal peptide domain-containing protein [Paucilactobacillus vaccinostercus]|uniref:KxYKxGKxW signal peptide domain-containing protein n=1 Tax=Paucilactobacillus vaccinostercus TaxID=176291 RepID=UPI00070A2DEC